MLIKGILYTHCPELNRYESILQGKEEKFSPQNSKHTSFVAIKSFVLAVILILKLIPYNSFHQRKKSITKSVLSPRKIWTYLKPVCRFSWSFPLFQFIVSTVFFDLPLFSVMHNRRWAPLQCFPSNCSAASPFTQRTFIQPWRWCENEQLHGSGQWQWDNKPFIWGHQQQSRSSQHKNESKITFMTFW